jgi:hypothetical protein
MNYRSLAKWIVVESRPCWAIGIRRFAKRAPLVEARSLTLAEDLLAEFPASFVCLAVEASHAERCCESMIEWREKYPQAAFAALISVDAMPLAPEILAAGAQSVACAFHELPRVLRMAKRHLRRSPKIELTLEEAIEAKIPWKRVTPAKSVNSDSAK